MSDGAPLQSAVGSTNLNTLARSMPRNQGRLDLAWDGAGHSVILTARYTRGHRNGRSGVMRDRIGSWPGLDLGYGVALGRAETLWAKIENVADRDPPLAQFALGYDPGASDPCGRVISIGPKRPF
ncbi:hypothetical protein [Brevundimonas lutea]|uniref:hypothetical protein n=1 Tax=Brevundimonas lutea TaxID=2293980 RepID=UPI000F01D6D2|nr:hypothetical protein [Brevundimonas lutea]